MIIFSNDIPEFKEPFSLNVVPWPYPDPIRPQMFTYGDISIIIIHYTDLLTFFQSALHLQLLEANGSIEVKN